MLAYKVKGISVPHITFYTQFEDSSADNLILAYKVEGISVPHITFYTQLKDAIFLSTYKIEDLYAKYLIFRHDKKASNVAPF